LKRWKGGAMRERQRRGNPDHQTLQKDRSPAEPIQKNYQSKRAWRGIHCSDTTERKREKKGEMFERAGEGARLEGKRVGTRERRGNPTRVLEERGQEKSYRRSFGRFRR